MGERALAAVWALAVAGGAGGCAVVGFDLGGYGPAAGGASSSAGGAGGAGGANASSSHHASSSSGATGGSGGSDGCGPDSVCADLPPAGFSGPVALYVGDADEACGGDYPSSAWTGGRSPSGAPAMCSTCTCDIAACTGYNQFATYSDAACNTATGTLYSLPVSQTPSCSQVAPATTAHVKMIGATTSGTCGASQVQVTTTPASFGEQALACFPAQTGASCGAERACFPAPAAPFAPTLCIYADGVVTCPPGYTEEPALFADIADSRTCTSCQCGPPATHCPASATVYTDTVCGAPDGALSTSSGCANLAAGFQSTVVTTSTPCAASGGTHTGSVNGKQRATFCCK